MELRNTRLWTALVTPMKENGDLDLDDLASLIHKQDEAGNGVLILGSTGEGLALGLEDKKQVVETASSLNIDVPVMVGVGGFNLREQIEWIEYCQPHEIDAFLLVTPLYAKPGVKGQVEWFRSLMDTADKPCMLYNVPSRTGVWLYHEAYKKVVDHPNLLGLKEAGGSIEKFQQYHKIAPDIPLYSGDDGMTPFFSMTGNHGLVSVASNVWPYATSTFLDWCLQGRGKELLPLWTDATNTLFSAPNPIPAKVLLKEKDWIKSSTLRPPLTDEEIQNPEHLLEADRLINQWYNENMDR